MSILLIDNYDSFTYTICDYLSHLGAKVEVMRNDAVSVDEILQAIKPTHIVISPGPCTPDSSGVSVEIMRRISHIPILGICLGHQAIGQVFGGRVIEGKKPMHGKVSTVVHNGDEIFAKVPTRFRAARYHSLIVELVTLPNCLTVLATSEEDGVIMAMKHISYPIYGLQFHPESIVSEFGHQILANFMAISTIAG